MSCDRPWTTWRRVGGTRTFWGRGADVLEAGRGCSGDGAKEFWEVRERGRGGRGRRSPGLKPVERRVWVRSLEQVPVLNDWLYLNPFKEWPPQGKRSVGLPVSFSVLIPKCQAWFPEIKHELCPLLAHSLVREEICKQQPLGPSAFETVRVRSWTHSPGGEDLALWCPTSFNVLPLTSERHK